MAAMRPLRERHPEDAPASGFPLTLVLEGLNWEPAGMTFTKAIVFGPLTQV